MYVTRCYVAAVTGIARGEQRVAGLFDGASRRRSHFAPTVPADTRVSSDASLAAAISGGRHAAAKVGTHLVRDLRRRRRSPFRSVRAEGRLGAARPRRGHVPPTLLLFAPGVEPHYDPEPDQDQPDSALDMIGGPPPFRRLFSAAGLRRHG
jgi:hypothetical protein